MLEAVCMIFRLKIEKEAEQKKKIEKEEYLEKLIVLRHHISLFEHNYWSTINIQVGDLGLHTTINTLYIKNQAFRHEVQHKYDPMLWSNRREIISLLIPLATAPQEMELLQICH